VTDELRRILATHQVYDRVLPEGKTFLQVIIAKIVEAVLSPDLRISLDAIKLILDRLEGKVAERVELSGWDNPMVQALQGLMQSVVDMEAYTNGKPKWAEGDGDGAGGEAGA
jgi:hypothetical protein